MARAIQVMSSCGDCASGTTASGVPPLALMALVTSGVGAGASYARNAGEVAPLAHLGIYGHSASSLRMFASLPETPLERAEGLEQLRALYFGQRIDVAVGPWHSLAVDTPDDLERARAEFLREKRRTA